MKSADDDQERVDRIHYMAAWQEALIEHPIREAYGPIVADLRAAGFDVDEAVLLADTQSGSWSVGLSILARHLDRGGYPDLLMYRIARRFARPEGRPFWSLLEERYSEPRGASEQAGAAHALAVISTPDRYEDLVRLIQKEGARGRAEFVEPIVRFGDEAGVAVVTSLRDELGYPVDEVLNRRKKAGARQRRFERATGKLDAAVAARPTPVLDPVAVEWSTSLDVPDWKRLATALRTHVGGELDSPLGEALFTAVLSAPLDDERHVLVQTRLGAVSIGWFIDDLDEVSVYIVGSPEVSSICSATIGDVDA